MDYLRYNGSKYYINYSQADGSFVEEPLRLMTQAEYEAQFDAGAWQQYVEYDETASLLGSPNRGGHYSASALPGGNNSPRRRQQGTTVDGNILSPVFPTLSADIDADGYPDLVDERTGTIWYQRENHKWVSESSGAPMLVRDLNNDFVSDLILVSGGKPYVVLSQTDGTYATTKLSDTEVDYTLWLLDFNRDGKVDLLATLSSSGSPTGYAYTLLFLNNGDGTFATPREQNYGSARLLFKHCQDIDGDGRYDLLAFGLTAQGEPTGAVLWLRGGSDLSFATPQELYRVDITDKHFFSDYNLNAADLDGDGKPEVWASRYNYRPLGQFGGSYETSKAVSSFQEQADTYIYSMAEAMANTRPDAPAKPTVDYRNGILRITWGDGSDKETSVADLSYALRVGTTPGGQDIVNAHALADGTRRNFLDGNMGHAHECTIDLRTHAPSTIYVSVQTVDAQYSGSAFSEEAVVEHVMINADFTLERTDVNINQSVSATYVELPAGYRHQWTVQDGMATAAVGNRMTFAFNAAGEKIIRHTVSAPDGTTVQATSLVPVLPNGMDPVVRFADKEMKSWLTAIYSSSRPRNPYADFTLDGRLDAGYANIYTGDSAYHFTLAPGTWNTGLDPAFSYWYDYTHNGAVDYLYTTGNDVSVRQYHYLQHDGTGNLAARQTDSRLSYLLDNGFDASAEGGAYATEQVVNHHVDITHNGYYDLVGQWSNYDAGTSSDFYLRTRQPDGSFDRLPITSTARKYYLQYALGSAAYSLHADFDRDGFTDFAFHDASATGQPYTALAVLFNRGEGQFDLKDMPFEQSIMDGDMRDMKLADFNNDGFQDIFAYRADGTPYILWNDSNLTFSTTDILPLGNLERFSTADICFYFEDLNNDGFLDIISKQPNPEQNNAYGLYVWYMSPNGIVQQGFIEATTQHDNQMPYLQFFRQRDHLDLYNPQGSTVQTIVGATNRRPAAPAGVRAMQTDEGLLIEWNDAQDDHTPAAQMRYNLSVRRAGQSGDGAYLISPQNGGVADAAVMPDFDYITATRYLIPLSALTAGQYEVSVQAIDLWNYPSLFSEPVKVSIDRVNINAPSVVCAGEEAVVSYAGETTNGTPSWNFDGGTVVSGSGFGPYRIRWDNQGTKTVTLALNDTVSERMVYIAANESSVVLPSCLFQNQTCNVTATTTDGSNLTASRQITVTALGSAVPVTSPVPLPVTGDGRLRICAQNLENYYYHFAQSTRPDYSTAAGFAQKTRKIVQAMLMADADIYAFNEVEASAIVLRQLADSMNARSGRLVYTCVQDGIEVSSAERQNNLKSGFIYRADRVKPVGENLAASAQTYYRETMRLQAFEELSSGERLTLSINHFKANDATADAGNSKRERNATDLVQSLRLKAPDPDVLILGDLNCRQGSSPMNILAAAGYTDQLLRFDAGAWTHCYGGASLIDHALANATMAQQITGAGVLHISTACGDDASANYSYRYSDHNPYIISINLGTAEARHTVTFNDHDSSLISRQQVPDGHSATAPADPVRPGWHFTGWTAEGQTAVMTSAQVNAAPVTADITYTAQYEPDGSGLNEPHEATRATGPHKFILDGRLYIRLPDGRTFDSLGREAR